MKPTYVLFVPGTRGPSVYHSSLASARKEAQRLLGGGSGQVMICRYIEGIHNVTEVRPLESNPLAPSMDGEHPF